MRANSGEFDPKARTPRQGDAIASELSGMAHQRSAAHLAGKTLRAQQLHRDYARQVARDDLAAAHAPNDAHSAAAGAPAAAGPTEAELRSLATDPQLVLAHRPLPAPTATPISEQKARALLARSARRNPAVAAQVEAKASAAKAKTGVAVAGTRTGAASLSADAGAQSTAPRADATTLLAGCFDADDLRALKQELNLSPRAYALLCALNSGQRGQGHAGERKAAEQSPIHKTTSFSMRGPRGTAAKRSPPVAATTAPSQVLRTTPLSWSAFARLLSHQQLEATLRLALLRLRDISLLNQSERLATAADAAMTRNAIAGEQNTMRAQLLSQGISTYQEWLDGKASVLRNAEKVAHRFERGILPRDGKQASKLRAQMRELERCNAQRQQTDDNAAPSAGGILRWVPATRDQPAHLLERVALTVDEQGSFPQDEQARYRALATQLQHEERSDVSSNYGRLVLSAAQLDRAAEQASAAAHEATQAGREAPATLASKLAERYREAATEHREAARKCGYLQALLEANRHTKPAIAQAILAEHQQLQEHLQQRQQNMDEHAAASGEQRGTLAQELLHLDTAIEDRALRIIGMRGAVATTDQLENNQAISVLHPGSQGLVLRARAVREAQQEATAAPEDAAKRSVATRVERDFSSSFPNEVVRVCLLSATFEQVARDFAAELTTLADPKRAAEHAPAAATLRTALEQWPDYLALCEQAPRRRLRQHVAERRDWNADSAETLEALAAEDTFWRMHPALPAVTQVPEGKLRQLFARLNPFAAAAPPPSAARHGASALDDATLDPVARFASPEDDVPLASRAQQQAHLLAHMVDGHAWAESYDDSSYRKAESRTRNLRAGTQFLGQIGSSLRGLAEGAGGEYTGLVAEGRGEAFAALKREQDATFGLYQQLLSLQRNS